MSERKTLSGGDWLSIGVFLFGSLAAVLMGYGLLTGAGGTTGTAAFGALIGGAVGPLPALLGGAGIAFLGARAFLTGDRGGLTVGILGMLGVAIGMSVVVGSLSELRGGSLGDGTGGRIAEMTHPAVGVLLGAIVAFGAAYFAWMREDPAAAAKLAPARRATPAPPKGDDGVTAAESAMLFPGEHVEEAVAPARPISPATKPVQPLYPEDVRLKGEVPAGTRPLTSPSALAAAPVIPAVAEPAVYRWTAPRAAADSTRIAPEEIEALADAAPPVREYVPAAVVEEVAEIVEEAEERPMPPRPTWETTGLSEDDEPVDAYGTPLSLVEKARRDRTDDEAAADIAADFEEAPVVAARIPREIGEIAESEAQELLEAVRAEESVALALEPAISAVQVVEAGVPVVSIAVETEVETGDEPVAAAIAAPEEQAEEQPEEQAEVAGRRAQQGSLLDELRAHNAAVRAEADVQDELDELEAELATADAELAPVAGIAAELVEEERFDLEAEAEEAPVEVLSVVAIAPSEAEEDADGEVEFEDEEREPPVAEIAAQPAADMAADDDEGDEADADDEASEPIAVAPAAAPRTKVAAAAPSLFDAVETEPQVVLKPKAAVPASRAEKAPGRGIDPEKKLLVEVGCMFVERGRVAVSMLQRQYDMDFDQACRVLDDLQEMGLIGPYMGGKNREILLTKDQWMEKVGAAVD